MTSVVKKMLLVVLKLNTRADCPWVYKGVLVSHGGRNYLESLLPMHIKLSWGV